MWLKMILLVFVVTTVSPIQKIPDSEETIIGQSQDEEEREEEEEIAA